MYLPVKTVVCHVIHIFVYKDLTSTTFGYMEENVLYHTQTQMSLQF